MSKKKIYIITRRAGYNFGSSLQAYALQNIFKSKGYDSIILNVKEMRFRGYLRVKMLNIIGFLLSIFTFLKCFLGIKKYNYVIQQYIQRREFDNFNNKILDVTKSRLYSKSKLKKYIGKSNIIVCGSDQIWNPLGFSPTMFLSFADPNENTLVSFAPSFGVTSLGHHKTEIAKLVNRFHFLSVREIAGVNIMKQITNKNVELTLDPTLLVNLSTWKQIEKPIQITHKKYILCYFLSTHLYPLEFISVLKQKYDLDIVNIQTNYNDFYLEGAINRADVSPQNFLYLISNADFICTNSYHCCIFSYIYQKEFYVFNRFSSDDKSNQNSRIETLLSLLNKNDRLVQSYSGFNADNTSVSFADVLLASNEYINSFLKDENEAK